MRIARLLSGYLTLTLGLLAFCCAGHAQRLSIGFVGGTALTNDFPTTQFTTPADPYNAAAFFQFRTGPRQFIGGASLEVRLSNFLSIETNVLHRPMTAVITYISYPTNAPSMGSVYNLGEVVEWEFPVLLKYRFGKQLWFGGARPFLEAGPSFRTREHASAVEPSMFGLSAGAGLEWRLGPLSFAPELRYTRWDPEHIAPKYVTKADQMEILATFAYHTNPESWRVGGRGLALGLIAGIPSPLSFTSPQGGAKNKFTYMGGVVLEARISGRFSIEGDAIYRPLRSGFDSNNPFTVITWDFPVLAKYRWLRPSWTPLIEAGPSFRVSGNLNGYNPSSYGFTAGGGVEKHVGAIWISPVLRYTRWAKDANPEAAFAPGYDFNRTNANSVELACGIRF